MRLCKKYTLKPKRIAVSMKPYLIKFCPECDLSLPKELMQNFCSSLELYKYLHERVLKIHLIIKRIAVCVKALPIVLYPKYAALLHKTINSQTLFPAVLPGNPHHSIYSLTIVSK